MDPGSWGGLIVGGAGALSGAYAVLQTSKAQRKATENEAKAATFAAADSMIDNLSEDNKNLRAEIKELRADNVAEVKLLRAEILAARTVGDAEAKRCHEHLARVQQDNANLRFEVADLHKALLGLRILIVDEVARAAAADELGHVDPGEAKRVFKELMDISRPPEVDRRLGVQPDRTPSEGDRRLTEYGESGNIHTEGD